MTVTRPEVVINMAASVDGKITSATRETPSMTSAYDRKLMDELRADADAIVIGAGTLRADDPPLGVCAPELRDRRQKAGKSAELWTVVVSRSLDIDPDSRFFREGTVERRIVATVRTAAAEKVARLRSRATIVQLGDGDIDVVALVELLAQKGVARLLVEGGGELNWAFVRAGLVDEIYLTIAPALLGGRQAPTLLEGDGFAMNDRRRLRLVDVHREDNELYCHYAVLR